MPFNFNKYLVNNPLLSEDSAAETDLYAVDQELGEPMEEALESEIDVYYEMDPELEALRSKLANIYKVASETDNQYWMNALKKALVHLERFEGTLADYSRDLGTLKK